ncbi:glycosyltransferase family 2 protein [Pedobacter sp. MC2016-24]|uniref:glycosyltransferase family 2 protein n=1 Tax=Pedobacter sp. MC2016-24 TaxID=2780090 RepID=UPI001880212A|nr:glycosyltransferase family 2 protein [Pedobacter sp. MC2016-24]MBE9599525.1 glycosyltransferase family 2 protein [Pedobacter sp. MC2016-24]
MKMKNVAIILTCHNRKNKTLECLSHLFNSKIPSTLAIQVFLVDDGSTDGTGKAVKEYHPEVQVVQGDGNLYWNRGMYLAWSEALKKGKFDFFIWLNDDTYLFENSIEILYDTYRSHNPLTIVCGSICSENGMVSTYGGFRNGKLLSPNGETQDCDYFNGNCVLIPFEVYNKIGSLDQIFHHALGDFDYGLRAVQSGTRLVITPHFIGMCEKHDSFPKWCSPNEKMLKRFKLLHQSSCDTNPFQFFIFDQRHNGTISAIFHFFTIHLRAFIPSIYNKRKSI